MYIAGLIYIFFECIFLTRSTVTYKMYESALNPRNIKMKIDGTIEFPTRDSKSVEHPVSSTENDSYEYSSLTSKISRMGAPVNDTGKTDKKVSTEIKSLKFWKWNDPGIKISHELSASKKETDKETRENKSLEDGKVSTAKHSGVVSVKETDDSLDKDTLREKNSNEDENDSTAKLSQVVLASEKKGKNLYKELARDNHVKVKKNAKHSRVVSVKETDDYLDKDTLREKNSNEDENDSTAKLSQVVLASEKKGKTLYKELARDNHVKVKKNAKHSRVVSTTVKESGKALDKELSGGNHSHEDFNDAMTKKDKGLGKHKSRKPKLLRTKRPEPGGVTQLSHDNRHHKVQDDRRIRKFTDHIYRLSLKAFKEMKQKSDSFTEQLIDTLVKSYKEKFTDFVTKTRQIVIKTREGVRNVLIHIIETSNLIMARIVNFLKANMVPIDELGPGGLRAAALRLDREMDALKQSEFEYACKDFGVCRNSDGIRTVLLDLISIIRKLPDAKLVQLNDAATEQLKRMDFTKIGFSDEAVKMIKKNIKSEEKMTVHELRFSLDILYGFLSKSYLPFIVNRVEEFETTNLSNQKSAVKLTVTSRRFIDALEEALPPTEDNKREWATAKDRLKRWADGHPLDIQDILQAFFDNIMKGIANSKRIKQLIAEMDKTNSL